MAVGGKINSNKLETGVKESALLKLQRDAKFHASLENNFEEREDCRDRV